MVTAGWNSPTNNGHYGSEAVWYLKERRDVKIHL